MIYVAVSFSCLQLTNPEIGNPCGGVIHGPVVSLPLAALNVAGVPRRV